MQKDNNQFRKIYESLGRAAYLGGWGRYDKTAPTKCHEEVWDQLRNDLKDKGDNSLLSGQHNN